MAYRLMKFAGVDLPAGDMQSDTSGEVYAPVLSVVGGELDVYGTGYRGTQPRLRGSIVSHTATVTSPVETTVKGLKAMLGTRGLLTREWLTGGTQQIEARLLADPGMATPQRAWHRKTWRFQLLGDVWLGQTVGVMLDDPDNAWTLDSGVMLDDGTEALSGSNDITLNVANGGNAPFGHGSLTVKAVGADITRVHVWQDRDGVRIVDWEYTNTITPPNELVVQFKLKTVKVSGTNYYRYFNLLPAHKIRDWINIPPGGGEVRVVITSTGTMHETYFGSYRYAWY